MEHGEQLTSTVMDMSKRILLWDEDLAASSVRRERRAFMKGLAARSGSGQRN